MTNGNGFDIDERASQRLNEGMDLGGGVELPFTAPVFWWLNGNAQARALAVQTPALFYGGWACNQEDLDEVVDDRGSLPGGLVKTEIYTREGKNIFAFTSRILIVAPIGFRRGWITGGQDSNTRYARYMEGARQHIQILALMGQQMPDKTYQSWGPIVLSAKGYQAQYLTSAMKDWKKVLEKSRRQHAPQVPAWAFWAGVGTFGNDINIHMVGKTAKSPITPVELFTPREVTLEMLRRLYVGKETVSEMADLMDEATDWLNAWKRHDAGANGDGQPPAGEYEDDGYIPPEPGMEDEIPF